MTQTAVSPEVLSEYDYTFVLDASGSMSKEDMPNGQSRWSYMQETVAQLARDIGKFDSDGIDLVIFNGVKVITQQGVVASKVEEVFATARPTSSTPLHLALDKALSLAGKSAKKDMIVIITDGEPDQPAAVESIIRKAANAQESDDALTFLFIQVGFDAQATRWLKALDDSLTGVRFDIVDVKTIKEVEEYSTITDLLIDAING